MPKRTVLAASDHEFCRLVAEAAFTNPFGEQFATIFRAIEKAADQRGENQRKTIATAVAMRTEKLERAGLADVRKFAGAERETMRQFFLFDIYERFYEPLDALVIEQLDAGAQPVKVPFARDALALLTRRGLSRDEALRVFAIFFQIRRAHHFIVEGLIGQSASMREFRRQLWESVFTHDIRRFERRLWDRMEDFSTLLLGETGTGKGTAAGAIGRSGFIPFDERRGTFSESFTASFVSLNLSQFPETLIESELFGHRKGAFTGAVEAHEGVFARCSPHGAIFLDEIGDISMPVQIKLLHVLQERAFSPVGSREPRRFRGRVIAATHKPLAELRARGLFRDDFYYRLCSNPIIVPPLRQRLREEPRELDDLLAHTLGRMLGASETELRAQIRRGMHESVGDDYAWPGNVRELEQAVRRILLTGQYVPDAVAPPDRSNRFLSAISAGQLDADTLLAGYCALIHEQCRNFEETARRTNLDRRTVKRYLALAKHAG